MITKHPTDAMMMPVYGDDFPSNWCIRIAEILRAERIKAYDLGRQEALEDIEKRILETLDGNQFRNEVRIQCAQLTRSMKHEQQ